MSRAAPEATPNRGLLSASIMLCTTMVALDMTIANVALPHVMGSLSASSDQITWVLTSYIVASAIVTPVTGWLAGRVGRKTVFLGCIAGFVAASMLCGLATGLGEMVAFRVLQGVFGAPMPPLAQAELLDMNPTERHGQAMAMFGMATLLGPILGPALGGYLTEHYTWRWVFYINLPLGVLALLGVLFLMPSARRTPARRFDFLGFGLLAVLIAAFQLVLDRGPGQDWFSSAEIWIEAILAGVALWIFVFYSATTEHPFFDPRILVDRNFAAGCVLAVFMFLLVGSSLALLPPLLQTVLGYPVQTAGLVMMPRALGTVVGLFVTGRLMKRVDIRLLLLAGLAIVAFASWQMSRFDLTMNARPILVSGFIQGIGMGTIMVPMSTVGFITLPASLRAEASSLFSVVRNMAQSSGISIMQALLTRNAQTMHASLAAGLVYSDPVVRSGLPASANPALASGAMALNAELDRQAAMVAFIDDFRLMMILALVGMPLLLLMRKTKTAAGGGALNDLAH